MSETSKMIRTTFAATDKERDKGLVTPPDIERFDNILYGENKEWQLLDVYRPKESNKKILPVIVSVHGGGWVYGDKECYQFYCMNLAQRGFAVVNFTYRLAPEYQFPSPLEDTNLVFHWILSHAAEFGFDIKHIFCVGDSAGGNILGLYAGICTNPTYANNYSFQVPDKLKLSAIALNCGTYKITFSNATDDSTKLLMTDYLPEKGSIEELNAICVDNWVTPMYPPTFLMTSTGDFLKNDALIMARKLTECNVPFLYRYYGSEDNMLGHVFHCNIKSLDAKVCNDDECDFFRKYM